MNTNTTQDNVPALPIPHCPIMLVLDTSHSMWGRGMQDQQDALRAFHKTLGTLKFVESRIEIAAVGMGENLRILEPFKPLEESTIGTMSIRPKGDTPIGGALCLALGELLRWTNELRRAGEGVVTPQLLILSDGKSSDDFAAEAADIRREMAAGRLVCQAVATGENPDMSALASIAGENVVRPDYGRLRETFSQIGETVSRTYEDAVPNMLMAETRPTSSGTYVESSASCATAGRLAGRMILVDGTNVCFWGRDGKTARLAPILALVRALDKAGTDWRVCFDASTRYHLAKSGTGDDAVYKELLHDRPDRFMEAPGGTCADEFLLGAAASERTAGIVSNDLFRDHEADYPLVGDKSRFFRGNVFCGQLCIPKLGIRCAVESSASAKSAGAPDTTNHHDPRGNAAKGFLI